MSLIFFGLYISYNIVSTVFLEEEIIERMKNSVPFFLMMMLAVFLYLGLGYAAGLYHIVTGYEGNFWGFLTWFLFYLAALVSYLEKGMIKKIGQLLVSIILLAFAGGFSNVWQTLHS